MSTESRGFTFRHAKPVEARLARTTMLAQVRSTAGPTEDWEELPCRVSGELAQVCCIPFVITDRALYDTVLVKPLDDGRLLCGPAVESQGRGALSVAILDKGLARHWEIAEVARRHRLVAEQYSPLMFSIDLPTEAVQAEALTAFQPLIRSRLVTLVQTCPWRRIGGPP